MNESLAATITAIMRLASDARRVAAVLQRHQFGIDDPHRLAIYHRLALVAQEFALAISNAAAALSPSARSAIGL